MLRSSLALAAVVAIGLVSTACAPPSAVDNAEASANGDAALFVASHAVWPSPTIPVCWVNPQDDDAMGWVRDQISRTWEAASAVRFVGWGTCTSADNRSVRIQIGEYWPNSIIGTGAYDQQVSMQLNFTFATFSPEVCQPNREFCIRAIAAHEFGHALGFDHEQNRPDTNGRCKQDDAPAAGDTVIGDWDQDSVMNYCNPNWNGNGNLSPTDIAGVRAVYGQTPEGPAQSTQRCGWLTAGQGLGVGQSVSSCDGRFSLVMQGDGNLVLYFGDQGALWASNTYGSSGSNAVMQDDGNFVLYDASNAPIWASNTRNNAGAGLAIQDDGNLVVYRADGAPIWASNTSGH